MARKGGQIFGTFALQTHERPKIKAFQKTPSKFASKNAKMAKNRVCFLETFTQTPLKLPNISPPTKCPSSNLLTILFGDRKCLRGFYAESTPLTPTLRPLCTQWSHRGVFLKNIGN